MKKFILPTLVVFGALAAGFLFASNVVAQSSADCLRQYHASQAKCSAAAKACIDGCPGAQGVDLGPLSDCLRSCNRQEDSCNEVSDAAYDACIATSRQRQQTPAEAEKQEPKKTIFDMINPYQIWLNAKLALNLPYLFKSVFYSGEFKFVWGPPKEAKSAILWPSIETDDQGRPLDFLPGFIPHESLYQNSTIRVTERTRLSDQNSQTYFELRPGQSNQAMLKIPSKNDSNLPFLEEGEIEVVKNQLGISDSDYDGIRTPNGTIVVVQTHFFVKYDKKNNQTAVVVYKGKVKITTNGGKTTTITPNGDKPGVVVVTQKLSVIKLALGSLALVAIIGGVIFLLKRRGTQVFVKKKLKR